MSEVEVVEKVVVETVEVPRGDRGDVGVATAALTLKQLWHASTHVLVDVGDRHNPRKQQFVRKAGSDSLKRFARKLLLAKDPLAVDWFSRQRGSMNEKRTDANRMRANLERQATKAGRSKKSQDAKNKAKKTEDAAATIVTKR